MIPLWAITGVGAAALASFATYTYVDALASAKYTKRETALQKAYADELAKQATEYNAKLEKLDATTADTKRMLDAARIQGDAAMSVVDSGAREHRRLRDALATSDLANRAALEAAGAASVCAATLEAASVRGRLLERVSSAAGEVESAAAGISRHADEAYAASVGCVRAYEVMR